MATQNDLIISIKLGLEELNRKGLPVNYEIWAALHDLDDLIWNVVDGIDEDLDP